jgi:hypothetical protein
MGKPKVQIKNWRINNGRLSGEVVDHPRFDPDTPVTTSAILKRPMNPKDGDSVETRNTIYILSGEGA